MDGLTLPLCGESLDEQTSGLSSEAENITCTNAGRDDDTSRATPEPIAIVGMAMRLPGRVRTADDFWNMLINKDDCSSEVPKSRYDIDAFYHPDKPQSVRTRRGYFLHDEYLGRADKAFLNSMSSFGLSDLDPQQMLLMEVVSECMENAGQVGWRGKDIGCYVGVFGEDWHELTAKETQRVPRVHAFATGGFALSNRISWEFDLKGPSSTIMTACSSSLVALNDACQAIHGGDCSSAVVAGTNMLLTPSMTVNMSENMVLSPDGYCKVFDAGANGYARGEAVNAVYIKPLRQAVLDGDHVHAVVRGTATNYDGKTAKIFTPDVDSHERLIRKAYHQAQIHDITETAFVECHGTGTKVGDVVETTAVARAFRGEGVYIGSVKSNIGHGEGASGLSGVIKAVLALQHRIIPPNMHFYNPNPKIPFEKGGLLVPTEPIPWPRNRKERVSVNCFGIGGSNAHAILESFTPPCQRDEDEELHIRAVPQLLVMSAYNKSSLEIRVKDTREYIAKRPELVQDLAYTLGTRRDHLSHRAYMIIDSKAASKEPQYSMSPGQPCPHVTFVFSGQGSSWPGMGAELIKNFTSFEHDIKAMDQILQGIDCPPKWSIEDALKNPSVCQDCSSAEHSQTLIAAVQIALVNLLRIWGVQPSAVLGHSSGEVVASYAANAIPMHTALIIAHLRGRCVKTNGIPGSMAVIGLSEMITQQFLVDGVVISCENSSQIVNISGDKEKLKTVIDRILAKMPDTFVQYVPVEVAYHSPDMQRVGPIFESSIAPYIQPNTSMTPMYSTVTNSVISSPAQLDAAYWRRNLESPVLFFGAAQALLEDKKDKTTIFLEIGPHAVLSAPLRQILAGSDTPTHYIPTLIRNKDQTHCLLQTAGELFLHHYPVNMQAVNGKGKLLTDLPAYPWDRQSTDWQESRLSRNWRFRKHSHHELLGSRMLEASDLEPAWRNLLNTRDVTWLSDHKILGEIVFPCAAYIAMINEAVRQLFNTRECTIRNLYMQAPLTLPQSDSTVELVTTARPVKISDRLDSSWYEFTIVSYSETGWTKHTTAQAKPGTEELIIPQRPIQPFPRPVSSTLLYNELEKVGLEYGPCFQGLEEITSHPLECTANATLRSLDDQAEDSCIHPATIDQCMQLLSVAACNGKALNMPRLYIPMSIDTIYMGPSRPGMTAEARGFKPSGNLGRGSVVLRAGNEHVLSMEGVTLVRLINNEETERDIIPLASHAKWLPDIDLIPNHRYLSQSQSGEDEAILTVKLSALSIIQIYRRIADLIPASESLKNYKEWIANQVRSMRTGAFLGIPEAQEWPTMNDNTLQLEWTVLSKKLEERELGFVPLQSQLIVDSSRAIVQGSTDPCVTLADDANLSLLDDWGSSMSGLSDWFSLLRHSKPMLRVLEIGAAKGVLTSCIRRYLTSDELRFYSSYTCTNTCPVDSAIEEQFKEDKRVKFQLIDISRDPIEQGFQGGSYDLVIASNLTCQSSELKAALQNIRSLLAPGGWLLLREQGPGLSVVKNLHMPVLPWGEHPVGIRKHMTVEVWDKELRNAGFNGIKEHGNIPLHQLQLNLITRLSNDDEQPRMAINLLCTSQEHKNPWICGIEDDLRRKEYDVQRCTLGQGIPRKGLVISLLDLDSPFFYNISEENWTLFQSLVNLSPRILWVTQSVELSCEDPNFGLVLGVSRTARQEQGLHFGTFQVDSFDNVSVQALAEISRKFFQETADETRGNDIDYEFALHKGTVYIPRFHWTSLSEQLQHDPEPGALVRLDIGTYGMVDSLHWVEDEPVSPGPDEVEVDIKYVGLNFRDIMIALGVMAHTSEFGLEASGIVRRCGNNAKGIKPGDRVFVSKPGLFNSRATVPLSRCEALPDSLSLEDAATIPVVYATALYCLVDTARLERGQSVLIHAACGGVGLAAIHVCQMIGAQIYATVGNEEKAQYLVDTFGLPRHHILNSRDASFLPDLMRETSGRGVDVVLNSLAGELLHASWKCVAEFGKMIEIGKRDFMEHGVLGLEAFGGNRAFFGVDLIKLGEKPGFIARLSRETLKLYEQGKIHPIRPVQVVAASEVQKAFRTMQQGGHKGKIVVRMAGNSNDVSIAKSVHHLSLSPEASYLLVGGLGGVGRALATWMVERGARSLVFLSRSAGQSSSDQSFLRELEAQGCSPIIARGDVTKLVDVKAAIERCPWPIGGVLQLCMLVRDHFIPDMAYEDWQDALSAKVAGTWNLHHALDGRESHLRFFVVCGSIAGVLGNAGQVNYCAANSFLASFVQYRLQKGLPASVVNLGAVDDVGFLATQDTKLRENMRSSSVRLLTEREVLEVFEVAMSQCQTNNSLVISKEMHTPNDLIVGMSSTKSLMDPSVRPLWGRDARFRVYTNLDADRESSGELLQGVASLQSQLAALEQQPEMLDDPGQRDHLITQIVKNIQEYSTFARGLEYAQVIAMPIDSLMTVEFRNWSIRYVKLDLSLAAIANAGTVEGLSQLLLATLRSKYPKPQ